MHSIARAQEGITIEGTVVGSVYGQVEVTYAVRSGTIYTGWYPVQEELSAERSCRQCALLYIDEVL